MAPILEVRNISKQYKLGRAFQRTETFREMLQRAFTSPVKALSKSGDSGPKVKEESFWALRDVNFNVDEGDVVGIIGRNGAGKSTLLKVISRITDPTEGEIVLRGRMASLLEVGRDFIRNSPGGRTFF